MLKHQPKKKDHLIYLMCLWFAWKYLVLVCKNSFIDVWFGWVVYQETVVSISIICPKSTNQTSAPLQPPRAEPVTVRLLLDHSHRLLAWFITGRTSFKAKATSQFCPAPNRPRLTWPCVTWLLPPFPVLSCSFAPLPSDLLLVLKLTTAPLPSAVAQWLSRKILPIWLARASLCLCLDLNCTSAPRWSTLTALSHWGPPVLLHFLVLFASFHSSCINLLCVLFF